ncbi:unnamed protein product, partial [Bubo scandiacus]
GSAPPKVKSMAKPFSSMAMEAGAGPEFVNINLFQMSDYLLSALITTQAKWMGSKFVNNSSWLGQAVAKVKSCLPYSSAPRRVLDGASRHSSKTHHNEGLNACQPGFVTIEEDSLCWHSL